MKVIIVVAWPWRIVRARLRRLDENAESSWSSAALCLVRQLRLPYHVGGVIEKESSLMVATRTRSARSSPSTSDPLRGDRHLAAAQDRRASKCRHR